MNDELMEKVQRALQTLAKFDRQLLDIDVNERSVSHKLAEHLQKEFPDWDVDCEYNRKMEHKKTLWVNYPSISEDDIEAKTVFPDIIVHHRETEDNLLVIEMKKNRRGTNTERDVAKVKAFTGKEYKYRFGLLLVIARDKADVEWFNRGKQFRTTSPIDFEVIKNGE